MLRNLFIGKVFKPIGLSYAPQNRVNLNRGKSRTVQERGEHIHVLDAAGETAR